MRVSVRPMASSYPALQESAIVQYRAPADMPLARQIGAGIALGVTRITALALFIVRR